MTTTKRKNRTLVDADTAWETLAIPALAGRPTWLSAEASARQREKARLKHERVGQPVAWDALRVAEKLDTKCSVDGLLIYDDEDIYMMAKRVQWKSGAQDHHPWPWHTITVRSDLVSGNNTELHKLTAAFSKQDAPRPSHHGHAYINDKVDPWELDYFAIAPTRLLLDPTLPFVKMPARGGNWFHAYEVDDIEERWPGSCVVIDPHAT